MSQLISDLNKSRIVGSLLKAQVANHVEVTDAHNNYHVATCAALTGISPPPPPVIPHFPDEKTMKMTTKSSSPEILDIKKTTVPKLTETPIVTHNSASAMLFGSASQVVADPYSKMASRTLYLGNLLKKVTDQTLKEFFSPFGHILNIEIKLSQYAFIQFTNINSVVAAILSCQSNCPNSVGVLLNNLQSPSSNMEEGGTTNFNGMLKLAKVDCFRIKNISKFRQILDIQ